MPMSMSSLILSFLKYEQIGSSYDAIKARLPNSVNVNVNINSEVSSPAKQYRVSQDGSCS